MTGPAAAPRFGAAAGGRPEDGPLLTGRARSTDDVDRPGQADAAGVCTPIAHAMIRGAGESGVAGALPSAVNAVLDALGTCGVLTLDPPMSPARIVEMLNSVKALGPDGRGSARGRPGPGR